jgi:hypothetical protein
MLYLNGLKNGKKMAVVDTDDDKVEYEPEEYLRSLHITIHGLYKDGCFPVEPPSGVINYFLNSRFRIGLIKCPYGFRFTLTFLPRQNRRKSSYDNQPERFSFIRTKRDNFLYYDHTCGRQLNLTLDEVDDRLKYYNETLVFQRNSILVKEVGIPNE